MEKKAGEIKVKQVRLQDGFWSEFQDRVIDIIEKAQQPDGYLDTYFIIKEPGRFLKYSFSWHQ